MANIHDAAEKSDLGFIQASAVVNALCSHSSAREAARTARRRDASRCCCGMLQQFHKDGGDIDARDWYATPEPDVPVLAPAESAASTARERCLFWPKISVLWGTPVPANPFSLGLPPYPLTPFSSGATPTLATPPPLPLFSSPCMPSQPTVPRALVLSAAWHRYSGGMPLMRAAARGHTNAVELLVRMGAAVNAQDTYNR
jgi:hypothetical protein